MNHESVHLCSRIADTSGLPDVVRLVLDPIARAAWNAANGIEDEKRRFAVLDALLRARDKAVRLLTAFMQADAHRRAILSDMRVDLAKMKVDLAEMRVEIKEDTTDVLDKVKVATEWAVMEALTEEMRSSKPVVASRKGAAS